MGYRCGAYVKSLIFTLIIYFRLWNEMTRMAAAAPSPQLLIAHNITDSGDRDRRDPGVQLNPDGSISGSISLAKSMNLPFVSSAFGLSENFRVGLDGVSFSESNSVSVNSPLGGFSTSNAMADRFGLGGGSSAVANAASFSNPLFKSSYSNANANSFPLF